MPLLLALALVLLAAAPAAANPWLERRVLHIAHQGGEREAPSNTFFAYEKALDNGADVLEMDVNITADRQLIAYHDTNLTSRTNCTEDVNQLTAAEIQARCDPADNDRWRALYGGIALGLRPAPEGFEADDFRIPTLREVLERYPRRLLNIEIKGAAPDGTAAQTWAEQTLSGRPTALDAAEVLAGLLTEYGRVGDAIVVSFSDLATERFKLAAPPVHTATGLATTAAFYASAAGPLPGLPNPRHVAVQPPTVFEDTIEVPTKDFVDAAHANGLAVHVWLASDAEETATVYGRLVDNGVDGIMTDFPSRLEAVLADRDVRWKPSKKGKRARRAQRLRASRSSR